MPAVGPRSASSGLVRSGRGGLVRRAAMAGGVLAASAVFFAALVGVADRTTSSAAVTRAAGRAASVKVDASASGAGTSGNGGPGWQPGPSTRPGGGRLPGHAPTATSATPSATPGTAGSATPRLGATPRAPARSNCTKEVLDEGALREAVAEAGPNDVICVKTGTREATASSGPTSTPAPASAPAPTSVSARASAPPSTSVPTPTPVPDPASAPTRTSAPAPTSVPVPFPAGDRGGPTGRLDIDAPPSGGGPRRGGVVGGTGDADGRGTADSGESGFPDVGFPDVGFPDGRFPDGRFGDGGFGDGRFGGGTDARTGVGARSLEPTGGCTTEVTDSAGLRQALDGAQAGDRICISGDLGSVMLEIGKGGSEQAPLAVIGNGKTAVKGIRVNANDVIVDGFQVLGGPGLGIEVTGNGVTLRHNTLRQSAGGDDGAGPDGGH
jgi:hypothetical protein